MNEEETPLTIECPDCGGDGYTVEIKNTIEQGCCGSPLRDGSCCGNAIPVQGEDYEQVPCRRCECKGRIINEVSYIADVTPKTNG